LRLKRAAWESQSHLTPYVWYVIFLLAVLNVFNDVDRMALSALAPLIKADLTSPTASSAF
jgi:hypothetical protein